MCKYCRHTTVIILILLWESNRYNYPASHRLTFTRNGSDLEYLLINSDRLSSSRVVLELTEYTLHTVRCGSPQDVNR